MLRNAILNQLIDDLLEESHSLFDACLSYRYHMLKTIVTLVMSMRT